MDYPSPDHSTFSRFRRPLSKDALIKINSVLLKQFHSYGLSNNKGAAVDARLVKSASRPVSQQWLEDIKTAAKTTKGKLDKNVNTKKFCRDLDSDSTVKNEQPHYGLKEHAAVGTENGSILSVNMSPASHHDSKYFPYAVCYSMHTSEPIEKAFGDKGYTGNPNREFLALNNITVGIMRKGNINATLTDREIERNKAI